MKDNIIAIDPGTESSALVRITGEGNLMESFYEDNAEILAMLRSERFIGNATLAIEMIASYGMAVGRETFETCVWIGRFAEASESKNWKKTVFIYRQDVKLNLCKSPRAKDANIRQALIDRFGIVGTLKKPGPLFGISSHKWAALGVAATFLDMSAGTYKSS